MFFQSTVNLVFGLLADKVPAEFIADREKLRGAKFDVAAMTAAIPQMRDQYRAHLSWIDAQLGDERIWLARRSAEPDRRQRLHEHLVRARQSADNADEMIAEFDHTRAWAGAFARIGHGQRTEMTTAEALDIAAKAAPETEELPDPNDPNGRKVGDKVEVVPDDYGKVRVAGEIVALSPQHIAIRRHDPKAGDIVVHFPRAGFLVLPAE